MAGKKRTDNKGRILRNGEMQRAEDNRYLYRYVDLSGKKRTVYALTLAELREKAKRRESGEGRRGGIMAKQKEGMNLATEVLSNMKRKNTRLKAALAVSAFANVVLLLVLLGR